MKTLWIIGTGMGRDGLMTKEAAECIRKVPAVMGARRMLENVKDQLDGKKVLDSYQPEEMLLWAEQEGLLEAAALMSGDTGFYSGARGLSLVFEKAGWNTVFLPGISSLSYFCARLKRSWENIQILSLHGRQWDLIWEVKNHPACFILSGGKDGIREICSRLTEAGLGECPAYVGENFSYENERITEGTIKELKEKEYDSLACMIVENPWWNKEPSPCCGLKDSQLLRGNVPMTKREVRAISVAKLELMPGEVFYDIGAGTGSITMETGRILRPINGKVYAFERKAEAISLIKKNAAVHLPGWDNLFIVEGNAEETMREAEAPDCAFLGGTGGSMKEMVRQLLEKNPAVRIVINVITLESLAEALSCISLFSWAETEVVQVSVSRMEKRGAYHMPSPQSPVYIITLKGEGCEKASDNC